MSMPDTDNCGRRAWAKAELDILRANPDAPRTLCANLLAEAGFTRSANAIGERRRVLARAALRAPVEPASNIPWPVVPQTFEGQDRRFLRALLKSLRELAPVRHTAFRSDKAS